MNPDSLLCSRHGTLAGIAVLFLAMSVSLSSQSLSIYNINSSEFPKITADYVAFDNAGNPISETLDRNDFRVQEQPVGGAPQDLSATLTQGCDATTVQPEASIVIVMDRSNSMYDVVNGQTRFKYAVDAVKAFVAKIRFVGQTRVALTVFSGNYELKVDWTNNPQIIYDTLNKLQPSGATNYELPFTQPGINVFDLLKQRPPNIPKYVFFLTDGQPNPAIGSPNNSLATEQKFVDETVLKFQAQGARFFAVSINVPETHWTIQEIARQTGGKSILTTEDKLVDLFSVLALETQTSYACKISWISPFVCSSEAQSRTVTITLLQGANPRYVTSYVSPPNSLARVTLSSPTLYTGDPPPSQVSYALDTLTAFNAPLSIDGYSITPSTYFTVVDWNFPNAQTTFIPFVIPAGQKRILRVEFKQGTPQIFRQAKLRFSGTPCPPEINLVGGQGFVLITSPNGGELFSTCDTVIISWAGVLPTQLVTLEYSSDDGASWSLITQTAAGLKYRWLPPSAGTRYRVRVSVSPAPQYQWAKQIGGNGNETPTSLALSCDELKVFATGYYTGPTRIGSVVENIGADNTDGYLAEFDPDGVLVNVTILKGSGSYDDRVVGAITDSACNLYVVGYHSSPTASFGSLNLSLQTLDKKNMFIYKFDPIGSMVWVRYGEGDNVSATTAGADSVGIRYDVNGYPLVVVVGTYQRYVRIGLNGSGNWEESPRYNNNTVRPYYAIYDANGNAVSFNNGTAPSGYRYQAMLATDKTGFTYETGKYTGPKSFTPPSPGITLPNLGGTDVYVSKKGAIPSSNDMSDASFFVKSPVLSFTITKATLDSTAQGQSSSKSFQGILCNTGDFPITITKTLLAGSYPTDFRLIDNLIGVRLNKGQCISLEFEFVPSGIGNRSAILIVEGSCGNPASLELSGEGLAPCVYDVQSSIDLGKLPLGQTRQYRIACVFRNTGPIRLQGSLSGGSAEITVSPTGPFDLPPNVCFDVTIDVNPTSAGNKSVVLNYGLASECGIPLTTINIEIVEPRVTITNVSFAPTRVGNVIYDTIRITNLASEPATLTLLTTSSRNSPSLVFTTPTVPPPITLEPDQVFDIPVQYNPQARGTHIDSVFVTVQGQVGQLTGEARGTAFLPEIAVRCWTFPSWTVGQKYTNPGYVTIYNTEPATDLYIDTVYFETPTADFNWLPGGMPSFPITLVGGDSVSIPVEFTPQAVGIRSVNVRVENDAKTGPGPIPPYAIADCTVRGTGVEPSVIPPIEMGDVLICATRTVVVTLKNPNTDEDLDVDAGIGTGDLTVFSISPSSAFIIPKGESREITIVYSPFSVGNHTASWTFANSQGLSLGISASGSGITTTAAFVFNNIIVGIVGQAASTPVNVTLGALDTVTIKSVRLTFTFDPQYLSFKGFDQPQQAGWTFIPDAAIPGRVVIDATADPAANLLNGAFVTPTFEVFLTPNSVLPLSFTAEVDPACVVGSGDQKEISVQQVCSGFLRLVKIGNAPFGIEPPKPNPASGFTEIMYSTGMNLSTVFEIVDGIGNRLETITTPIQPSGVYQLYLDVSRLGSGMYLIRMISGPFSDVHTLYVVK